MENMENGPCTPSHARETTANERRRRIILQCADRLATQAVMQQLRKNKDDYHCARRSCPFLHSWLL